MLLTYKLQDSDVQEREQHRRGLANDDGVQETTPQRDPHRLPSHHPRAHHRLRHQLLQGLLLRGHRHCQPYFASRPHHSLHQRLRSPSSDSLCQNGNLHLYFYAHLHLQSRICRSVFSSKHLPTQVDIWLIFAQIVPWIEVEHLLIARNFLVLFNICKNDLCSQVLLHTLIDVMRTEGEEGREVSCSCLSTKCLYL